MLNYVVEFLLSICIDLIIAGRIRLTYAIGFQKFGMIEIRAYGIEACMEDIRLLATLIVEQMKS